MIHSSINIANEYVSDFIVAATFEPSMSSMAPYLITSLGSSVPVAVPFFSTMFTIAKSQINGSP